MKNIYIFSICFMTCFSIFNGNVLNDNEAQRVYKSRIFGGELAKIVDYPYHAIVYLSGKYCGGTIIGPRWILTAGHCISNPAINMWVMVGTESIKLYSLINRYSVKKAYIHPEYEKKSDSEVYSSDCAILKLQLKIGFGPTVKAIKIGNIEDVVEGKYGVITGFGISEFPEERESSMLRVIRVPILSHENCLSSGRERVFKNVSEFCVGGGDKKIMPCSGDSGGGFVADNKLLGVYAYGQKKSQIAKKITRHPVFYKVPYAKQWIRKVTGIL